MGSIEDIKTSLMKVVANMPQSVANGTVPLRLLIEKGIVAQQADMKPVYADCNAAAAEANAEALSRPQAVRVTFDFATEAQGGGVFSFRRLRTSGY